MQYMELPRIVLSSIEKSEIVEEIFICPHCFNKTTQQYPEDEYKSTEAVCSHCGAKFVSENKTSTMKGTVNWTPSNIHSIHGIFITTDTIEGQKGALYIEAEYVQFVCDFIHDELCKLSRCLIVSFEITRYINKGLIDTIDMQILERHITFKNFNNF